MKSTKRQLGQEYTYTFSDEEITKLLTAYIRKEHWETPHPKDIAGCNILKEEESRKTRL